MADTRKTALITGSGKNIGRASAHVLARMGYNIVINGSSNRANCDRVADEVRAIGTDAHVIMCDVGDKDQVEALAAEALEKFGTIDVLVNNAAVRPNTNFLDADDDEWDRVFNIDFHSARRLSKALLPGMIARGWGRIINFSGMYAMRGYDGKAPVSAAKHASWGMTKCLAKQFAPDGITVNIISPGPIGDDDEGQADTKKQKMLKDIPTGRLGTPAEVACMVGLLVSDEGAFINGQMLQVNGAAET